MSYAGIWLLLLLSVSCTAIQMYSDIMRPMGDLCRCDTWGIVGIVIALVAGMVLIERKANVKKGQMV